LVLVVIVGEEGGALGRFCGMWAERGMSTQGLCSLSLCLRTANAIHSNSCSSSAYLLPVGSIRVLTNFFLSRVMQNDYHLSLAKLLF
jgi:hypothetical protein